MLRTIPVLLLTIAAIGVSTLSAPPALAQGGPPAADILVLGRSSLYVIDSATTSFSFFSVSDPDGNSIVDTPMSIAAATTPASGFAFVTYAEGHLAVVFVPGQQIFRTYNVNTLVDASGCVPPPVFGLELRGVGAAIRRSFPGVVNPVERNDLHIAATTRAGEAFFIVLDQERLIFGAPNPVIDCGVLESGAKGLDVTPLDNPAGSAYSRALYTVGQIGTTPKEVAMYEVSAGRSVGSTWTARELARSRLAPGQLIPETLKPGTPPGRELAVFPQSAGGPLLNPYLGGECNPGGDFVATAVTGPGPNSYEVWALDPMTNSLRLIDPGDCDEVAVSVGSGAMALTTVGRVDFGAVFVANRDSDSVSRVNADGTVTTITLGSGGGTCTVCPRSIDTLKLRCDAENLRVARGGTAPNGDFIYHLEWDALCPPGTEFTVECACRSDVPNCPCGTCDCTQPGQPAECECPFFLFGGPVPVNGNAQFPLLQQPGGGIISEENPWLELGTTDQTQFDHPVDPDNKAGIEYQVKTK